MIASTIFVISPQAARGMPGGYRGEQLPSESNTLYRAHTVFIGMSGAAEVDEHAALLLTGDNAGIIFEPNFGFYKFTKQPTEKYEDCFESIIDDLYIINRIHSMTFRKSRTLKT